MKDKNIWFVVLLAIFVVALDLAFGKIYKTAYFSEESRRNDRLIHSVLGANEDILIFGSSRALHHYNPKIFEDALGMTCYNLGSGGQNIYFHLALLNATLERYTPKIVILELMTIDFEKTPPQWDTEKLGVLLPFANHSESARQAVLKRSDTEKIKLVSNIYPYNSLQYTTVRNNFIPFNNHYNGFIPLNKKWDKPIEQRETEKTEPDPKKVEALFSFIETCKTNNIQLFVVVSPHYVIQEESSYSDIADDIYKEFNIQVLNFEKDTLFLNQPELFNDPFHLNLLGADVFSQIISNTVK